MRVQIADRFRRAGAVLDTNLFLLWLIGGYAPDRISQFRAISKFDGRALRLLNALLGQFSIVRTSTQVLTEVDNLSRQTSRSEWPRLSERLRSVVGGGLEENTFASRRLFSHPQHATIGITDCSLVEMARDGGLVVTDDRLLTAILLKERLGVINLSHYLL